jgi:hypothetical protein
MKAPSNKTLVLLGLALVAILAASYIRKSEIAMRIAATLAPSAASSEAPKGFPQNLPTVRVPQYCNAYARNQYSLENPPATPPPDNVWWGCSQGYVELKRGPNGATECRNAYTGKLSPPQKFEYTGKRYYGCSFEPTENLWQCPTCEV